MIGRLAMKRRARGGFGEQMDAYLEAGAAYLPVDPRPFRDLIKQRLRGGAGRYGIVRPGALDAPAVVRTGRSRDGLQFRPDALDTLTLIGHRMEKVAVLLRCIAAELREWHG